MTEFHTAIADRLAVVREAMQSAAIDVLIIPVADPHHTEWLPQWAQRVLWLTGFAGSSGTAIVQQDSLTIVTDGRYADVVESQCPVRPVGVVNIREQSFEDALRTLSCPQARIGFDPWLHSVTDLERLSGSLRGSDLTLVALAQNPIDLARGAPAREAPQPAYAHEVRWAGASSADKRAQLGTNLRRSGIDAVLLSAPESICWLLNIRGEDHPETPLVYAFALAAADGAVDLFVDPQKVDAALRLHLGPDVRIHPYGEVAAFLRRPGRGRRLLLDPGGTSGALETAARDGAWDVVFGQDPCLEPKAIKHAVEIGGARECHRRDGVVLCGFWHWWERRLLDGPLRESEVRSEVDRRRAAAPLFRSLSFETIPASGPNAALPHYHVTPGSDRALQRGELFLLDSGSQYRDGTTDITRTFAVGEVSPEMRRRYTQVFKAFVRVSTARFPPGARGIQVDALARDVFWRDGADFDHSTGHGVGSFLGVHEGPNRMRANLTALAPLSAGMITSIEPGFYALGGFGVRIENLAVIVESERNPGEERAMLEFDTLTLCPIDTRPLLIDALADWERSWLNAYHARVRDELSPLLDDAVRAWLEVRTRPI